MEEKTEKILFMCTCCENDPDKAHIPFVLGNAALAMDIKAMIALQGRTLSRSVRKDSQRSCPPGGGLPPMKELLDSFMALGGELGIWRSLHQTPEYPRIGFD